MCILNGELKDWSAGGYIKVVNSTNQCITVIYVLHSFKCV